MLESVIDMVRDRKSRPRGATWNIDETARLDIIARMEAMQPPKSRTDLATDCGVTPPAITQLLKEPIPKGKTRGCKFLDRLERSLGMVSTTRPPAMITDRELWRRLQRIAHDLSGEELENWVRNGEMLAGKR